MMFGYACRETDELMPLAIVLSHMILMELSKIRKEGKVMKYLRPDSKSQVTIEYNDQGQPERVHTIVVSTQQYEFDSDEVMQQVIKQDVEKILIPQVI
jgi:S-adenosylmethionine synthetase